MLATNAGDARRALFGHGRDTCQGECIAAPCAKCYAASTDALHSLNVELCSGQHKTYPAVDSLRTVRASGGDPVIAEDAEGCWHEVSLSELALVQGLEPAQCILLLKLCDDPQSPLTRPQLRRIIGLGAPSQLGDFIARAVNGWRMHNDFVHPEGKMLERAGCCPRLPPELQGWPPCVETSSNSCKQSFIQALLDGRSDDARNALGRDGKDNKDEVEHFDDIRGCGDHALYIDIADYVDVFLKRSSNSA